ncbi:adrenodoxin, mitochondrial [Elgaria multicarinata webbii]|uniref:adrenodoxin, mitochondrial n=1 Tax=Elgaria multicarinata webbii TaxID=159646 RepID=UPI002FCD6909
MAAAAVSVFPPYQSRWRLCRLSGHARAGTGARALRRAEGAALNSEALVLRTLRRLIRKRPPPLSAYEATRIAAVGAGWANGRPFDFSRRERSEEEVARPVSVAFDPSAASVTCALACLDGMATSGATGALLRVAAASSCRRLLTTRGGGTGRSWGGAANLGPGRLFHASALVQLSSEDKVTVHFINRDGDKLTAKGKVGDSLLDVVVDNNVDIDGFGACEGTLACSTCHLIFEDHIFEKLDAITDEEMDMLDLAYGLTEKSRLGCQICLKKSMNNMTVRVPETVADARQSMDMSKTS